MALGPTGMSAVQGIDFTLDPGPPLVQPPLSLIGLSRTVLDLEDLVGQQQMAAEKALSAQSGLSELEDTPFDAEDSLALVARQEAVEAAQAAVQDGEAWLSAVNKRLADLQRWEHGFVYLPELSQSGGMSVWVPDSGTSKDDSNNQTPIGWYDPFVVVAKDARSAFGWPNTDIDSRARRAVRALQNHEAWDVEREFWSGVQIPTNWHLSASPSTPTSSAHRTTTAWPNPDPASGTVLGTAYGLGTSLAALDQSIADSDAGTGIIHATPFLVQRWASVYSYLRDSGGGPNAPVWTVNHNLILPGYGYPGTGPDVASRSVTDGVLNSTTTVTSATATFTTFDIGSSISDDDGEIPAGAYIVSVTSATSVVISAAATASEGSATLTIGASQARLGGNRYQWAYATDMVFTCNGAIQTYPWDWRQQSPDMTVDNLAPVRAERSWATITNDLLRAAVLVDTQTA